MARIPMADKAGFINIPASGGHQSGTPGMNWGMEESQAMAKAGDQFGNAMMKIGHAAMDYAVRKQETEDRLSYAELQTRYTDHYGQLTQAIKDNPGMSDDDVKQRTDKANEEWDDIANEYYGRMSTNFRQSAEAQVKRWQVEGQLNRNGIRMQAYASAAMERSKIIEGQMMANGDWEGLTNYYNEDTQNIYSPAMREAKKAQIPRLREEWEARRQFDSGDMTLSARLKERNEDGTYKNFLNMSEQFRDRLIKACDGADAKRRADAVDSFTLSCYDGVRYTREQIREMAGEDKELELSYVKIAEGFARADESNQRQQIAEAERTSRYQQELERQQEEIQKQNYKNRADSIELSIYELEYPADHVMAQKMYDDFRQGITTEYAADPVTRKRLLKSLESSYSDYNKTGGIRNSYGYQLGMRLIGSGTSKDDLKQARKKWHAKDVWGFDNSKDPEVYLSVRDQVTLQFQRWYEAHPNATETEIRKQIDDMRHEANTTKAEELVGLFAKWNGLTPTDADTPNSYDDEIFRDKNGNLLNGTYKDKNGNIQIFKEGRKVK